MTLYDWMDLLWEAKPALVGRGWKWRRDETTGRMQLRDAEGYCPLCALASLHGCDQYRGAWSWALTKAFSLTVSEVGGAWKIAGAADSRFLEHPLVSLIRAELNQILEPTR